MRKNSLWINLSFVLVVKILDCIMIFRVLIKFLIGVWGNGFLLFFLGEFFNKKRIWENISFNLKYSNNVLKGELNFFVFVKIGK